MSETHSDFESAPDAFAVKLDAFRGPLDLLLHHRRTGQHRRYPHRVDHSAVRFTPSSTRDWGLDIAGEFLVMAATLSTSSQDAAAAERPPV
jgi:hypothetical protein